MFCWLVFQNLLPVSVTFYHVLWGSITFWDVLWDSVGFHEVPECSITFHMLLSPSLGFYALFSKFGPSLSYLISPYLILSLLILSYLSLPYLIFLIFCLPAGFWCWDICDDSNIQEVILMCDSVGQHLSNPQFPYEEDNKELDHSIATTPGPWTQKTHESYKPTRNHCCEDQWRFLVSNELGWMQSPPWGPPPG